MIQIDEITPILNISNMETSILWFRTIGWELLFIHGEPPKFASVGTKTSKLFLSLNSQGGTGKSGMWLCVWVPDVDAVFRTIVNTDIQILTPPTDEPWNVREMQIKHPDGHVLRFSRVITVPSDE